MKHQIGSEEWINQEIDFLTRLCESENKRKGNISDGVHCDECLDKGLVYFVDKENLTLTCRRCSCMEKRQKVKNAMNSGLGNLIYKKIDDYKANEDWQKDSRQKALDYMKNPEGWFIMFGQAGSGKTLLCGIVSAQMLRDGYVVEFKSWPELIRETSVEWFKEKEVLKRFKEVPVLYIDDFLKINTDSRSLQIAYEILNYRYNYNLPTIISGELSIQQLMKLDEAIASRIVERSKDHLIDYGKEPSRNQRI